MEEFFKRNVRPQRDKPREQFQQVTKAYDDVNKVASSTGQIAKMLVEKGSLSPKVDFKVLNDTFNQDDIVFDNARDEFIKVVENDKDKKRVRSLKSEIGKDTLMAMGLKRGITTPDGRRSVKLGSDNIYRGFLLSMAASPERSDEFKQEWENARDIANSDDIRKSGKGQTMLLRHLMDKGLISQDVINDPKLGKVWRNALEEVQ
jgi:hypothetical protein